MRDYKKIQYLVIIILIAISLVAFGRIAGNDFINFDDEGYITENDHIKSGINRESIQWAFTHDVLKNWVPLAVISHMLDWRLFGANPAGHHMVSLLWHIGAVILLFLFLYKTTDNLWSSAFAAAFFAVHPLRVESVAWASERKDVLSMFFGMASLYAYAFYAENLKISRYFVCLVLFALSLLSKSMLVTLPFVFLLLDYWPLGRWPKAAAAGKDRLQKISRLILEKIPFLFLTVVSAIITFLVQHEPGAAYPPFIARVSNAVVAYPLYLGKTFWPFDLSLKYFFTYSFDLWQIIASFIILSGMTATVLYFFKKKPYLFVGWSWFLGTLFPVIGLIPTSALVADHYTYLSSIGIAVMLAYGIPSLIKNDQIRKKTLCPAAVAVIGLLIFLTWQQCGYWKNSITFWNHAVKISKDNPHAYLRLGIAYGKRGEHQRAIYNFNKVIAMKPHDPIAYNCRGIIYYQSGQHQLAIENYNHALRLKPDYVDAYNNRALIYLDRNNKISGCNDARKACELGNCTILENAVKKGYCD